MLPRKGNVISLVICVSQVREHISLGICVSEVGKHKSRGICVSQVGEHISLEICVSQVREHILIRINLSLRYYMLNSHTTNARNISFPGRGTHIICFPGTGN